MVILFRCRAKAGLCCLFALAAVTVGILLAAHQPQAVPADGQGLQTTNEEEGICVPAVMYHGMLKDASKQGKYVISPETFEKDLQYLKANGYTAVGVNDLLDYVDGKGNLPEKPILLTFDDGYYNNYLYAYPLAKQYEMKIILSPIGYYTDLYSEKDADHPNYSHVTWDEVREMLESGVVEIQNHTYNLHASNGKRLGAKRLKGEDEAAYQKMLRQDLQTMQDKMTENTGITPTAFVFPFGAISDSALPVVRQMGFRCYVTCESRMNRITRDPECLFGLGRTLRPPGTTSEAFFQKLFCQ